MYLLCWIVHVLSYANEYLWAFVPIYRPFPGFCFAKNMRSPSYASIKSETGLVLKQQRVLRFLEVLIVLLFILVAIDIGYLFIFCFVKVHK
jgi:hypothetical protein